MTLKEAVEQVRAQYAHRSKPMRVELDRIIAINPDPEKRTPYEKALAEHYGMVDFKAGDRLALSEGRLYKLGSTPEEPSEGLS